ncbi:MAG: aminodeoxychorismate synthase component I [Anaerolineales bacterium]|nr:aminodeoxychorismate synthase component I [Anaerolineales bacterium]
MSSTLIFHDDAAQTWRTFQHPIRVLEVHTLADILPALHEIEQAVNHGLWAAGFLAYEAAPAFDPAMVTHPPVEGLPLLWFGLYEERGKQEERSRKKEVPIPDPQFLLPNSPFLFPTSPSHYATSLAHIKEHIAAGDTYQVNYTLRLRAPLPPTPLLPLFQHLIQPTPPPYAAYLETGRFVICSTSPELFFTLDRNTLRSKPMKGTAPRGHTLAEDQANAAWLAHSEKNRAENLMIVDMIRNDMGRIATTGSVHVPRLFEIERYPTVLQMTSTVACETRASLPEILTALFPCASITGAPKIRTMEIIRALEPEPRGVYTGTIGFIAPNRRAQFNVAIRTVVVDTHTGQAEYGVGSGIVWDSEAAEEYAECEVKAQVLKTRRPAFDLLESLCWTPEEGYFLLERHLARMRESAEFFDFPFDEEKVRAQLVDHPPTHPSPHKTRLLLTRAGEVTLEHQPLPLAPFFLSPPSPPLATQGAGLRVTLAATPVSSADVFLYHKTTHRAVYEAARAACPGYEEVLLWNERGEVTEFTASNVVVRLEGAWFTPPVTCGLLGGTLRGELLAQGTVTERVIPREQVMGAEAVWVVNSVRGWRRVEFGE